MSTTKTSFLSKPNAIVSTLSSSSLHFPNLTSEKITLLIVDDHALIRENWVFILSLDCRFSVVGQCGSAEEAIELTKQRRPNIILMDINLPGINGMDATPLIRKYAPGTKVIGVSLHSQPSYARRMMQSGASGYVTKNSSREELFKAIVEVQQGKKYVCEEIKNILAQQVLSEGQAESGIDSLSHREIQVISFIKRGCSSKEIAQALTISVKTVEVHRYNILRKLNLKNAAALVNYVHNANLGI